MIDSSKIVKYFIYLILQCYLKGFFFFAYKFKQDDILKSSNSNEANLECGAFTCITRIDFDCWVLIFLVHYWFMMEGGKKKYFWNKF
jgi:hypothetical protein